MTQAFERKIRNAIICKHYLGMLIIYVNLCEFIRNKMHTEFGGRRPCIIVPICSMHAWLHDDIIGVCVLTFAGAFVAFVVGACMDIAPSTRVS